MTSLEFILISFALIVDTIIVCTTNGMIYKNISKSQACMIATIFGVVQGILTIAGYYVGLAFESFVYQYSSILTALIFGVLGIKKIKDTLDSQSKELEDVPFAIHSDESKPHLIHHPKGMIPYRTLAVQSIATSLDAFAVGISFSIMAVNIFTTSLGISVLTIICCYYSVLVGQKSGELLGKKAELLGGIFLILVGLRSLL
ncbi:MAG: hypothetical protein ATN36_06865 [Epulopiscium sp. Nele67-Bin005]|nr:MAG: hypothetical protein ATN36_06865 [Epulopiscium sp. Nele67-Bin005]